MKKRKERRRMGGEQDMRYKETMLDMQVDKRGEKKRRLKGDWW